MLRLFNGVPNVRDAMIDGTSGYDVHFMFPPGHEQKSQKLRQEALNYLRGILPNQNVHITDESQFDEPVGPWPQGMWQIKLCTVPKDASPSDPSALDTEKRRAVFVVMKQLAKWLEGEINQHQYAGSLLIHANVWPDNSDQQYERTLHFEQSWLVTGPSFEFIDIWGAEKGLIEMDAFIRAALKQNQPDDEIKSAFIEKFSDSPTYSYEKVVQFADVFLDAQKSSLALDNNKGVCVLM